MNTVFHASLSGIGDHPADDRHYSATCQALDLDHLIIHGQDRAKCPFPCRYFGDGLPEDGVFPTEYEQVENDIDDANYC